MNENKNNERGDIMNENENFVVKTTIGAEQRIIKEIEARISSHGTMSDLKNEIISISHAPHMNGYIIIQATARHHVERLIGREGIKRNTTPLKGAKKIIGILSEDEVNESLKIRSPLEGLELGGIVTITKGPFKGETATLRGINEIKEECDIELHGPLAISVKMMCNEIKMC